MNTSDECVKTAAETLDLVTRAQKGDAEAFDELFERYLPRVRLIAALKLNGTTKRIGEIDDLVQEALLKALRKIGQFKNGEFRRWMNTIVDSVYKDMLDSIKAAKRDYRRERSLSTAKGLSAYLLPDESPSASAILKGKELEVRLDDALAQLSDAQRQIIVLRQLYGLSYGEISDQMKFGNEGSARVAFSRALDRLKTLLLEESV